MAMESSPEADIRGAGMPFASLKEWAVGEGDCLLAILFGSMAGGRATINSDVDLALWWRTPLDASTRETVNCGVTARIARPLDLVDLRRANGILLRQILTEGKTLVEREAGLRGRLYVRLMDWETDHAPAWHSMLAARRRRFLRTDVKS